MPVRIRVRIRSLHSSKEEAATALVNSGFETDTPQIHIPMKLAEALGMASWLSEARIESYGSIGGLVRAYVLPASLEVWVDEENAASPRVVSDAVITGYESEVLISDYLAGELGIVVEDFREGIWRLRSD